MLIHNLGFFRLIITLQTVNFNIALGRQFVSTVLLAQCLQLAIRNVQLVPSHSFHSNNTAVPS